MLSYARGNGCTFPTTRLQIWSTLHNLNEDATIVGDQIQSKKILGNSSVGIERVNMAYNTAPSLEWRPATCGLYVFVEIMLTGI